MGVQGLWRLLDSTGTPVALETLEGKVLAVDVSIWLHQVMQGYQDGQGNPLPNAHLLGLFNRICKLLYYRIKPVFVFDGGVPLLKKNTIASRRKQKSMATSKAQKMKSDLINNLLKRTAVKGALGTGNIKELKEIPDSSIAVHSSVDLFKLPVISSGNELLSTDEDDPSSDTDSTVSLSPRKQAKWIGNIHSVDVSTAEFKALPPDVRHDILTDLKATRKQNSWGRLHEMPEGSHDFSNYQMKRLLKRRNVQECLEEAEKEMGGKTMTLEELDILLTEQGIVTTTKDQASRIAADNITRFVYINGIKKSADVGTETNNHVQSCSKTEVKNAVYNLDNDDVKIIEDLKEYEIDYDSESDWESHDIQNIAVDISKNVQKFARASNINPAMMYMLEHSGLSQEEIMCIIEQNKEKCEESSKQSRKNSLDSKMYSNTLDLVIKSEPIKNVNENSAQIVNSNVNETNLHNSPTANIVANCDSWFRGSSVSEHPDQATVVNNPAREQTSELALSNQKVINEDVCNVGEIIPVVITSESDSDDFVEVDDFVEIDDLSQPNIPLTSNREVKPPLKIAIRPEMNLEDDIFADVFTGIENEAQVQSTRSPEIQKEVNIVNEQRSGIVIQSPECSNMKEFDSSSQILLKDIQGEIIEGTRITPTTSNSAMHIIEVSANGGCSDHNSQGNNDKESTVSLVKNTVEKDAVIFPVHREGLLSMQAELEKEEKALSENLGRLVRQATDITDQMRLEAQELLRLFGIPFIVAPMEAEAQCAYLETINLTDGTITDDSDIWLFGGRCVYKNFFNLNKHVLQFRSGDIQHYFKLTREQMIQLALLVGSDYTVGISGIGPVTALEILGAFPAEKDNLLSGLTSFSYWINAGRTVAPGRGSLRTKLKNIRIEKGFPSQAVVQAYLTPTVDESTDGFTWNKPNATLLSDFTREKFGWTKNKFEEIFNPIIKRQAELHRQKGIDTYFQRKVSQKSIGENLSKRVQRAVERLGVENIDDVASVEIPRKLKRKTKPKPTAVGLEKPSTAVDNESVDETIDISCKQPCTSKQTAFVPEYIPQREMDKTISLKNKLHAIEVFRKSKKGLGYVKKSKRIHRKAKEKAELSESSDSS